MGSIGAAPGGVRLDARRGSDPDGVEQARLREVAHLRGPWPGIRSVWVPAEGNGEYGT